MTSETDARRCPIRLTKSATDRARREGGTVHVRIAGADRGQFAYDFEPFSDGTATTYDGDVTVVCLASQRDALRDATLDDIDGRWVVRNPNPAPMFTVPPMDLSGPLEDGVERLLDTVINPVLAAHDGSVELLYVRDGRAYVQMNGGCQGCALSSMTLRSSVANTLHSTLPELVEVVDRTDHDAGERPYYAEEDLAPPR